MIVSTILTKNCLKDFLLMKKTFDLYHRGHTYNLACDSFCFQYLKDLFDNVFCTEYSELKEGDHVAGDVESKNRFREIIKIKFKHTIGILQNQRSDNTILWCDVDHIFLNPIDSWISNDMGSACLTPHYSNNFANEGEVGFYNCGFVFIKNLDFLLEWERLYNKHEELGIYYEQKALELACKAFRITLLPINYNVGWWKFMNNRFEGNSSYMSFGLDVSLYKLPVVNFHFHFFKQDSHSCNKNGLKDFVLSILTQRNRPEDLTTLKEIERLENENI